MQEENRGGDDLPFCSGLLLALRVQLRDQVQKIGARAKRIKVMIVLQVRYERGGLEISHGSRFLQQGDGPCGVLFRIGREIGVLCMLSEKTSRVIQRPAVYVCLGQQCLDLRDRRGGLDEHQDPCPFDSKTRVLGSVRQRQRPIGVGQRFREPIESTQRASSAAVCIPQEQATLNQVRCSLQQ